MAAVSFAAPGRTIRTPQVRPIAVERILQLN